MEFEGKIWKSRSSKYWLVEVPSFDIMTEGTSREDALVMIVDAIKEQLISYFPDEHIDELDIVAREYKKGIIGISASESKLLLALSLRRQRTKSRSTVREVADRLGSKSPNSYAQYERGEKSFSLDQYERLVHAANPSEHLRLRIA